MKKKLLLTIALIVSILSLSILGVACNKEEVEDNTEIPLTLTELHYIEDSIYGLYFYGPDHEDSEDEIIGRGITKLENDGILEKDDKIVIAGGNKILPLEKESKVLGGIMRI